MRELIAEGLELGLLREHFFFPGVLKQKQVIHYESMEYIHNITDSTFLVFFWLSWFQILYFGLTKQHPPTSSLDGLRAVSLEGLVLVFGGSR